MDNGIWIIDGHACTMYANDRMAEILGTSRAEMLGKASFEYVFESDLPAAKNLFSQKQQGDSGTFKFQLRRKDGTAVQVEVQGTPMYDSTGKFNGIVGTFKEV